MVIKRRPAPSSNDNKIEKEIEKKPRKPFREILEERQKAREMEEIEKSEDNEMKITNEYDIEKFQASISITTPRGDFRKGVLTVVNSSYGKRVTISKDLMRNLNNPKEVSISFSEDIIAIGERLPNNDNLLNIKINKNKSNIYSSGLVLEITNKYRLDFSNRTSITFSEVEYIQHKGFTIAIIKVK